MAKSPIEDIVNSETLTDAQKVTNLYDKFKQVVGYLTTMRERVSTETAKLDALMNANGNNPEEHHAKTMVFYGRKLSIRDLLLGVKSTDPSAQTPLEVGTFIGLDDVISQNDYGRVPVKWDCKDGMSGLWKADGEPETQYLEQNHMIGSKITMPSIRNMDNDGRGTGTNTYKVKSGYTITGWQVKQGSPNTNVYLYNDNGNDYVWRVDGGVTKKVVDKRIFQFGQNEFKLPFNPTILPDPTNVKPIYFVLNYIPIWFSIEFVVRHGTIGSSAPCSVPLKTKVQNTVTLPLATLIEMDSGWQIDTDVSPYGQWTTVDPNTGTSQVDPDGDTIADKDFTAGTSQIVGTDLDAGIRRLYLKIKSV